MAGEQSDADDGKLGEQVRRLQCRAWTMRSLRLGLGGGTKRLPWLARPLHYLAHWFAEE